MKWKIIIDYDLIAPLGVLGTDTFHQGCSSLRAMLWLVVFYLGKDKLNPKANEPERFE